MSSLASDIAAGIGSVVLAAGQGIVTGVKFLAGTGGVSNIASTPIIHASAPSSQLIQALLYAPKLNAPNLMLLNDMIYYSNLTSYPYTPGSQLKTTLVNLEAMNGNDLSTEYEQNLSIMKKLLGDEQKILAKIIANPKSPPNEAEIALLKNIQFTVTGLLARNKNIIAHCQNRYSKENVKKYCEELPLKIPDPEELIERQKTSQKISDDLLKRYAQDKDPTYSIRETNINLYKQLPESIKNLLSPPKPSVTPMPAQAQPLPTQVPTQAQMLQALTRDTAAAQAQPQAQQGRDGNPQARVLTDYQTKNTATNSVATKTEISQEQLNTFKESIKNSCPTVQVFKKADTVALTAKSGNELCAAAAAFSKQYNPNTSFKLDSPNLKMALEILEAAEKNQLIISSVKYQDEQGKTITVEGEAVKELFKNKGQAPSPAEPDVTISHFKP